MVSSLVHVVDDEYPENYYTLLDSEFLSPP